MAVSVFPSGPAIVTPLVFLLVFGVLEAGYAFFGKLTVDNMSVVGTRAATAASSAASRPTSTNARCRSVPGQTSSAVPIASPAPHAGAAPPAHNLPGRRRRSTASMGHAPVSSRVGGQ